MLLLIFSFHKQWSGSVFSVACMSAGASMLGGGLFGFLFGIPRSLQAQKDEVAASGREPAAEKPSGYGPNTNLEQISDWLTKILGRRRSNTTE